MCIKPFDEGSVSKHCHMTGKYRGAAHTASSLKLCKPLNNIIPVVYYYLCGYNSHSCCRPSLRLSVGSIAFPYNMEKYISFILDKLHFVDSTPFVLATLHWLVAANKPGALITSQPCRARWAEAPNATANWPLPP